MKNLALIALITALTSLGLSSYLLITQTLKNGKFEDLTSIPVAISASETQNVPITRLVNEMRSAITELMFFTGKDGQMIPVKQVLLELLQKSQQPAQTNASSTDI